MPESRLPRVGAPKFPLTEAQFREALRTGHGRAMMQVRRHGAEGAEEALIDAATAWNIAKAERIAELICRAGLETRVQEVIRETLTLEPSKDNLNDRKHRCSVLSELAKRSVPGARSLLYSLFHIHPWPGTQEEIGFLETTGDRPIIELDGADGLIFLVRRLGQYLARHPDFIFCGTEAWAFDESQAGEDWRDVLKTAAERDDDIRRYLAVLHQREEEEAEAEDFDTDEDPGDTSGLASAEEIIALVNGDEFYFALTLGHWGCQADPKDRREVFAALLEETEPNKIAEFLHVFEDVGPPYLGDRLFSWIELEESGVRNVLVRVLGKVEDPRVRELAIRCLTQTEPFLGGIALLENNFQPGDHRIIEYFLSIFRDGSETWQVDNGLDVSLDLLEANLSEECTDLLIFIYETSSSSEYRFRALWLMNVLDSAPDWVIEEAQLDEERKIRALAEIPFVGSLTSEECWDHY